MCVPIEKNVASEKLLMLHKASRVSSRSPGVLNPAMHITGCYVLVFRPPPAEPSTFPPTPRLLPTLSPPSHRPPVSLPQPLFVMFSSLWFR
ncbi:hypothetical protein E2C01_054032 [Portunus trituberculatus]|uniref:Uncharacterized protein n=1 Tax=Portunus trituberculatus TaxID=210409 RepID=A0A5B7GS29_PORTR|nr:hypothetical protein [Portunus trituberculatus]